MIFEEKRGTALMLLSLSIGTFMSALDTSVVTMATPVIQNYFGVSMTTVEWVITAYLLVISCLLLTFGRLADLHGHRKIYLSGFAIFTAGSLLCGLSADIAMLIACRVVQAFGAAMMFSSSSAIITANVPAEKRGKAFGIIAVAVASACCAGPVLGGLFAGAFGWRSIFFINVPVGIIGLVLAAINIPADKAVVAKPFDAPGALLVFASLFLMLLPLDLSASGNFPLPAFAFLMIAGPILAVIFVLWEKRCASPMLNLDLFKNRVFSASLLAAAFNYAAQFIMAFLAPFYFQQVRLLTPAMTGLLYMAMPLATMLIAPISGSFSDRHDSRIISSAGMGVMAVSLFMLSFAGIDTPYAFIVVAMALAGAGSGMFQSPNNSAIMGCAPAGHRGAASGILATMRNFGMVMGVALSGAIFNAASSLATVHHAQDGLSALALKQTAFTSGLHVTFLAAAVIALCAMAASLVKGKTRNGANAY